MVELDVAQMGENNGMIKVEAHIKDRFKAQKKHERNKNAS